jgi:hypothetical protein
MCENVGLSLGAGQIPMNEVLVEVLRRKQVMD